MPRCARRRRIYFRSVREGGRLLCARVRWTRAFSSDRDPRPLARTDRAGPMAGGAASLHRSMKAQTPASEAFMPSWNRRQTRRRVFGTAASGEAPFSWRARQARVVKQSYLLTCNPARGTVRTRDGDRSTDGPPVNLSRSTRLKRPGAKGPLTFSRFSRYRSQVHAMPCSI